VESRLESVQGTFSLASINGEAEPRTFRAGQRVPAGAVNLTRGAAKLTAQQAWSESLLAQLLKPTERAGVRHVFLEKIIRGYLIGIIAIAVLSGTIWWFTTGDARRTWSVVTAVLVVSCPCAIGLAFPLADEMATVALRRRGLFVRDSDLWARLGRVRKLVFDKTGTLTLETPVLLNPEALWRLEPKARAALHALVRDNAHPVSQCLLENLLAGPMPSPEAPAGRDSTEPEGDGVFASELSIAEITELVGDGVVLPAGGKQWALGRPGWRNGQPRDAEHSSAPTGEPDHGSEFTCDGTVLARFHFADTVRPDVRQELTAFERLGFSTFILSGDRSGKVAALAADLGLPPAHAIGELTPNQKAIWIEAHDLKDTLMLGDGANDSLAFDRALCRGTPVIHHGVLEQKADFYYLGRGIGGLRALFSTNSIRRRTQTTILVFSVAYNTLAVGLAVTGHMNPLVAAILMPINSLLTLAIVTGGMRRAFAR
jgi:Cu2+-exporting ATPase